MKSVAPKAYQSLPERAAPAGYICVLRDVDSDAYRIEGAHHPKTFIEAILNEEERDFGIELVSILETSDLRASASELYRQYHATLSDEWLWLDPYQLQEMRGSALRIDAHSSHYLTPRQSPQAQPPEPAKEVPRNPRRRMKPRSAVYKQYGARALRKNRSQSRLRQQREASQPVSIKQKLSQGFDKLMLDHPWLVLLVMAIILLICLLTLEEGYYGMRMRY